MTPCTCSNHMRTSCGKFWSKFGWTKLGIASPPQYQKLEKLQVKCHVWLHPKPWRLSNHQIFLDSTLVCPKCKKHWEFYNYGIFGNSCWMKSQQIRMVSKHENQKCVHNINHMALSEPHSSAEWSKPKIRILKHLNDW